MPEFTPPQTKHTVTEVEFLKALRGEEFEQTEWFFRKRGIEILLMGLPFNSLFFEDVALILVLLETELIAMDRESIHLTNIGDDKSKIGLMAYQSILPPLFLQNSELNQIYILESQTSDITISEKSNSGNILISENSSSGDITISENSNSGNILISENSSSGDITISENSNSGNILISENSNSGDITISENSNSGNILISENSNSLNISISENSNSKQISIFENSTSVDIRINEKSSSGDISISEKSKSEHISIDKNSTSGDILIYENSTSGDILIYENSTSGGISIYESSSKALDISGNFFTLSLSNAQVPIMKLENCYLPELCWLAGTRGELYISHNSVINHLNLEHTALLKDALISIVDSKIHIAELDKLVVQGQLILRNITALPEPFAWEPPLLKSLLDNPPETDADEQVKAIHAEKIKALKNQQADYEEGLIKLKDNFPGGPIFRISNSSLGKTEITGSDLTGFRLEYRDSKLLDTFIAGSRLPKNDIQVFEAESGSREEFEQKTSVYNQLKKIFDNQGDVVEASWYHAKAMENQEKLLKLDYQNRKGRWFSEIWFQLINFKFNKISNNHGESWRRALVFVLGISLAFYTAYYLSIHYQDAFSFSGAAHFFGDYFSFLDPTHKIDFHVPKDQLGFLAKFLDFLGRVFIAYGIYQFIAAFRKNNRRQG